MAALRLRLSADNPRVDRTGVPASHAEPSVLGIMMATVQQCRTGAAKCAA